LADNRHYFTVDIPKEITLLVVDDNPSSFFKAALSSIQENTNIKFTTETFSSWARQSFDVFKVIVLVNFSIIAKTTQDRLKSFLQQGGISNILKFFPIIPGRQYCLLIPTIRFF
jgi:hypothetical protein